MSHTSARTAKTALLEALDVEALVWARRRHEAHDDTAWWEAKSRWMLLLEARALVATVSETDGGATFLTAVTKRIGEHEDWSWGASWPGDVHVRACACAWMRAFVASSIAEVRAMEAQEGEG